MWNAFNAQCNVSCCHWPCQHHCDDPAHAETHCHLIPLKYLGQYSTIVGQYNDAHAHANYQAYAGVTTVVGCFVRTCLLTLLR